mgnify:CR=1 FL=1
MSAVVFSYELRRFFFANIFLFENYFLLLPFIKTEKTMFETHFKAELKRLNLKRYDVCELINCTMPTLKSRLQNPESFTIGEILILENVNFNLIGIIIINKIVKQ